MPVYKFRALDVHDNIIENSVKALTLDEAKQAIVEKGFTPIRIEESKGLESFNIELFTKIKTQDIVSFCRELAIIMKSGISLSLGLDILLKQSQKKLRSAIQHISAEVQKGRTLAQAMKEGEYKFPELLVKMISTGEASGNIDSVLNDMADYYERENYIKHKIKSATVYPVILIVVATCLIIFFANFILPSMEELLEGQSLPFITKLIINVTHLVGSIYSLILILIIIAGIMLLKRIVPDKTYRQARDRFVLKLPIIGSVVKDMITVRFIRTLYLLYKSGLNIVSILDILKKTMSHSIAEETIDFALDGIKRGEKLGTMLSVTNFFDPLIVQMISIGEETGELERILEEIALFYERKLELNIEKSVAMIEPVFTLVIGGLIALVIVAMALPIFSMVGNLDVGRFDIE